MVDCRLVLMITLCVAFAFAVKPMSTQDNEFIEQREIDPLTQKIIPYQKHLFNGEGCINSAECKSGCCLRQLGKKGRQCAPRSLSGKACSNIQVKGGMYMNHCPCEKGEDYCTNGICRN